MVIFVQQEGLMENKRILVDEHSLRSYMATIRRIKNKNIVPLDMEDEEMTTRSLIKENILIRSILKTSVAYSKEKAKFDNLTESSTSINDILISQSNCFDLKNSVSKMFKMLNMKAKKHLMKLVATTQNKEAKNLIMLCIPDNKHLKDAYESIVETPEFKDQKTISTIMTIKMNHINRL